MINQVMVLSVTEVPVCTLSNSTSGACPIIELRQIQDAIDGGSYGDTISLTVPANHADAANLIAGNYILFQDKDAQWQEYKLMVPKRTDNGQSTITITGEHAFYELLGEPIGDIRPTNTTAGLAVTQTLTGTRWSLGNAADLGSASVRIYRTSVLAGLVAIATTWKGELKFRINVVGGVISSRSVDILAYRGNITGKRFEMLKDMLSVTQTIDISGLCTALIGRGKGIEIDGQATADPAYGKRLEFDQVVWTNPPNPANKPINQNWIGDAAAAAAYGPAGRHIYDFVEFDDITDANILLQSTYDALQLRKVPKCTYEMSVVVLEELTGLEFEAVRLGDTVNVINNTMIPAITGTARVIHLDRNLILATDCKVTLGNYIPTAGQDMAQLQASNQSMADRQGVWDRATAFGLNPAGGGTLQYALNLLTTQLGSTVSGIYTDVNGNYIFEDVAHTKAIKLGAGILAIANTKVGGVYQWTTFATGDGIVANSVLAAIGTFLNLTCGTPGAQRREMGNDAGTPYENWYNSSNVLVRKDTPGGIDFYDANGIITRIATTIASATITVGSGQMFASIQVAYNSLPMYINHYVKIEVYAGTYAENVMCQDKAGPGTLVFEAHSGDTVNVSSMTFNCINVSLVVQGFTFTGNSSLIFNSCSEIDCENNTLTQTVTGGISGIQVSGCSGTVAGNTISNKSGSGIMFIHCNSITIYGNTGTNNGTGITINASIIYDAGNSVGGTVQQNVSLSLVIDRNLMFSGNDNNLITGIPGASGNLVSWDDNGNTIDSGIPVPNVPISMYKLAADINNNTTLQAGMYTSQDTEGGLAGWKHILNLHHLDSNGFNAQLMVPYFQNNDLYLRVATSGAWSALNRLLTDGNIKSRMQCGRVTCSATANADSALTFPVAFPSTAVVHLVCLPYNNTVGVNVRSVGVSTIGATIRCSVANAQVDWIAMAE